MKAKHLAPLALLLPLSLLAACGGNPELDLHANWYSDPVHVNIQSDLEELSYEVTYTPPTRKDPLASFTYETGTYTTSLQERSSLAAYGAKGTGYTYHTELKIAGSYTYGNNAEESFENSVVSDVVLMNVDNMLQPVRSEKRYKVTTYYAGAVQTYDYTYTATYNEKLSETEITVKDLRENVKEEDSLTAFKKMKLKGSGTFLDNEEILLVLRCLDLSAASTFRTVNPVTRERMNVTMATTPKNVKYTGSFTVEGTQTGELGLDAVSFSIGYTASKSGLTQSLVYALPSAEHDFRNVLLEMTTTAPDGAGMFTYKLKELNLFGNKKN